MKTSLVLGAACGALLLVPATSLAAGTLPSFTNHLIVPNVSVAQFKLNEPLATLRRQLPKGDCTSSGSCQYNHTSGSTSYQISFLTYKRTTSSPALLGEISFSSTATSSPLDVLKTAGGIGLGSTAAAVKRAYPHAKAYGSVELYVKGHGAYGTSFSLSHGRVVGMSLASAHFG